MPLKHRRPTPQQQQQSHAPSTQRLVPTGVTEPASFERLKALVTRSLASDAQEVEAPDVADALPGPQEEARMRSTSLDRVTRALERKLAAAEARFEQDLSDENGLERLLKVKRGELPVGTLQTDEYEFIMHVSLEDLEAVYERNKIELAEALASMESYRGALATMQATRAKLLEDEPPMLIDRLRGRLPGMTRRELAEHQRTLEKTIVERQEALASAAAEHATVQQRDAMITDLRGEIRLRDTAVAERDTTIALKDAQLAKLRGEVTELDRARTNERAADEARRAALADREAISATVGTLRAENAELARSLELANKRNEELAAKVKRLEVERPERAVELAELERQHAALPRAIRTAVNVQAFCSEQFGIDAEVNSCSREHWAYIKYNERMGVAKKVLRRFSTDEDGFFTTDLDTSTICEGGIYFHVDGEAVAVVMSYFPKNVRIAGACRLKSMPERLPGISSLRLEYVEFHVDDSYARASLSRIAPDVTIKRLRIYTYAEYRSHLTKVSNELVKKGRVGAYSFA